MRNFIVFVTETAAKPLLFEGIPELRGFLLKLQKQKWSIRLNFLLLFLLKQNINSVLMLRIENI